MKEIIAPVDRQLLRQELSQDRFMRHTNYGSNELYVVTHLNAPNTVQEIGRLRELAFRAAGGGTGEAVDLDEFDLNHNPYEQLIVWNPEDQEIVGGYRFLRCDKAVVDGQILLATTELFEFSEQFITDFMPLTIELGRSFVQPKYQPNAGNRKGLFSLDNLWDGLGGLIVENPDIKYFFGKVTMYPHFNALARDMILTFMNHYFPDPDRLMWPHHPLVLSNDMGSFRQALEPLPYQEGYKLLNSLVRKQGENIPPLVNSYMNLSSTMRNFGTAVNEHFGSVEETGILVTIPDIYETKKDRHVRTYHSKR